MVSSSNIETDGALPDTQSKDPEGLVKSKQRVADHGEVFTPSWMVEDMLNLVKTESERIDSRFLEPACGSGNFLKSVLKRKLTTVQSRYGKSDFERRHHAQGFGAGNFQALFEAIEREQLKRGLKLS